VENWFLRICSFKFNLCRYIVGAPPLRRRDRRPRTLAAARANVERALVPLRTMPGAIPPALTWSTEGMLKGMRENIFGLLWYVKQAVPRQSSYSRAPAAVDAEGGEGTAMDPPLSGGGSPTAGAGGGGYTTPRSRSTSPSRFGFGGGGGGGTPGGEVTLSASTAAPGSAVVTGVTSAGPNHKTTSATFQYVPLPVKSAPKAAAPPGAPPAGFGKIEKGRALSGYEALGYPVELYKLNAVDPELESIWFQALNLK
jgi:hypothetical protein